MNSAVLRFVCCLVLWLALAGTRPASAVTHFVTPSGIDDTAAIQAALDACSYPGANCTIQFRKGIFYTRILAAENFHGTIRGMGQDKTFLKPVSNQLAPDVDTCSETGWASPISKSSKFPVIMQFTGGSLTISDLTFQIDEPVFAADQSWCGGFQGLLSAVLVTGAKSRSRIERVGFEGKNAGETIWVGATLSGGTNFHRVLSGSHSIVSSSFRGLWLGILTSGAASAMLNIGGSPAEGNTFANCSRGIAIFDYDKSIATVSHNHLEVWGHGISVGNVGVAAIPTVPSRYLVSHNRVRVLGVAETNFEGVVNPNAGIEVGDSNALDGSPSSVSAWITQNQVELTTLDPTIDGRGIQVAFAHGSVVACNKIAGNGTAAIDVPPTLVNYHFDTIMSGITKNCLFYGNNIQGFNASLARIYLGPQSIHCTVIGNANDVLDEGTGNRVIGEK